jgi:hypothetical protein
MNRWLLLAAFGFLTACLCTRAPAVAGLHFCNQTTQPVDVAIAVVSDFDNSGFGEGVSSLGWWTAAAGECATPISGDLDTRQLDNSAYLNSAADDRLGGPESTDYWYYARGASMTWAGNGNEGSLFCVTSPDAFNYVDRQPEGCTKESFRSISTGGATDYTVTLTPA